MERPFLSAFFGAVFKRVFTGKKICLTYFELCQTYFELSLRYFFLAPMWGKHTENQFSLFPARIQTFPCRFFIFLGLVSSGRENADFVKACACMVS